MDALRQDIRYAFRTMRRSAGFTMTVLLTLGIGIGANTAIFSFVDTLLLRPLPYPQPEQIVMVWEDYLSSGGPAREWFTPPDYRDLRDRVPSFEATSPLLGWGPTLTGAGDPEQLSGGQVNAGWFDIVAIPPALGRRFVEEDERGDGRVVVLADGLWKRRFGGDPSVVGRSILLNGEAHEVVGVMPADFRPPFQPADLWQPITSQSLSTGCQNSRGCYVMQVIARVDGAAGPAALDADLERLAATIREEEPGEKLGLRFAVVPLQEQLTGAVRPALLALLGAVGLLLLIGCVNIANLLLARSAAREREVAVRTAIGARRPAILRQLLVESSLLGLLGGAVGTLLSLWGVRILAAMSPAGTPRVEDVTIDGRVLLFAMGVSILTGLLFGLVPALQLAGTDLTRALRETAGPRASGARRRLRDALVIGELAIALTLLAGAGLLIRSFLRLQAVDPGFNPENVLTASIAFPSARYPEAGQAMVAVDNVLERLNSRSDVRSAGATTIVPLASGDSDVGFLIAGRAPPQDRADEPIAWYRQVTPGYFDAMGIRVLKGRGITADDRSGAPSVAVINETLARRHWADSDPIGGRISVEGPEGPWTTVVGVAADVRQLGPDRPARAEMFLPLAQLPARFVTLVARTTGEPTDLVPALRAEVAAIDRELPLAAINTMESALRAAVAMPRLYLSFFTFFALVALVLAGVGIYGVTAYAVAQRTSEIGVRMALGADASDVLHLVLRQALALVAIGLVLGTVLALALSRVLATLLFDLSPTDPLTFITIAVVLAVVAIVASWLPARRATRVDPLHALRAET